MGPVRRNPDTRYFISSDVHAIAFSFRIFESGRGKEMRSRRIGSVLILAALSACVSTTDVEVPDFVYPDSSFQAVVTCEIDSSGAAYGFLGVLVPYGWEADSVMFTEVSGDLPPYSGIMIMDNSSIWIFEDAYPSGSENHWIAFWNTDWYYSYQQGDVYTITLTIHTNSIIGSVDIAFLAVAGVLGLDDYLWNGDPCSTTVEVVELNLEQSTWGSVKNLF